MSLISIIHYLKLIFRFCLFAVATVLYVFSKIHGTGWEFCSTGYRPLILIAVWIIFVVEMFFRFFPSRFESMGCQKQFKRNFKPIGNKVTKANKSQGKSITLVAIFWIALNSIIGVLYYIDIIDEGILVLISLAFSVCDMICILFFCPFQTWVMKNKCCTSCRIYNWDYAMMFTPLIFIKDIFILSILIFAVVLLLRWEITAYMYPERFSESVNACLSCAQCEEKLCHHKKQLKQFLNRNYKKFNLGIESKHIEHTRNNLQQKIEQKL